MLSMQGP